MAYKDKDKRRAYLRAFYMKHKTPAVVNNMAHLMAQEPPAPQQQVHGENAVAEAVPAEAGTP